MSEHCTITPTYLIRGEVIFLQLCSSLLVGHRIACTTSRSTITRHDCFQSSTPHVSPSPSLSLSHTHTHSLSLSLSLSLFLPLYLLYSPVSGPTICIVHPIIHPPPPLFLFPLRKLSYYASNRTQAFLAGNHFSGGSGSTPPMPLLCRLSSADISLNSFFWASNSFDVTSGRRKRKQNCGCGNSARTVTLQSPTVKEPSTASRCPGTKCGCYVRTGSGVLEIHLPTTVPNPPGSLYGVPMRVSLPHKGFVISVVELEYAIPFFRSTVCRSARTGPLYYRYHSGRGQTDLASTDCVRAYRSFPGEAVEREIGRPNGLGFFSAASGTSTWLPAERTDNRLASHFSATSLFQHGRPFHGGLERCPSRP
ncbi:hypothetical protein BDP55DRAFT_27743 [Colletotrichum godetiae]|uniref:Uncharacterized protein n=1 Tax=Colletotrichum godetiae TaxID=1209918 RepID=A0AAJ0AV75_9PEZI|nr:uncharacterized protein BDP55DRAFT_27743 [Colletotrichum godetiae]KAK1688714.1 hypothetical protein BDP55DRAFT_27743 [Colletotrichum godetiae]